MPNDWVKDEDLWNKAKKEAANQGKRDNWAYIVGIYKKMGGTIKSLHLVLGGQDYEVLGELDNSTILVKSNGDVLDMPYSDYYKSKRVFKSLKKDLSHLVPMKRLVTREGKTFYVTYWVDPNTKQTFDIEGNEVEMPEKPQKSSEDKDYRNKIAQLDADIAVVWQLYARQTYTSKNLGALAVREGVQNSIDAIKKALKAKQIKEGKLDIDWEGDTLTIEDNGIGMDVKTLHTSFLKIGGTTKRGEDDKSTGGFGVAKAVILGCGGSFEIETQDNYLNSEKIGTSTIEQRKRRQGTKLTINDVEIGKTWDKKVIHLSQREDQFEWAVLDYLETSAIPDKIKVTVKGKEIKPRFKITDKTHRDLSDFNITQDMLPDGANMKINVFPFGRDKDGKSITKDGYIYVRLNGLTQYKYEIGWDSTCNITLDITTSARPGSDDYPFTTSREQMQGKADSVIQRIREMMRKNPVALGDRDKYIDTVYDVNPEKAKEKLKEQLKIVDSSFIVKESSEETSMSNIISTLDKLFGSDEPEGIHAQGSIKKPGILQLIKQRELELKQEAQEADMSVEEYIQKKKTESNITTDNPLENAWIVSKEATYETNFDPAKHVQLLVVWDSICREVLKAYNSNLEPDLGSEYGDFDFYPGFILEDRCLAMSATKPIIKADGSKETRKYIMINPETLPSSSVEVLAGYLRGKACHELAHYLLGNMDNHGESHSYTREALDDASLAIIPKLEKLVRDAKLVNMAKKASKNRQKFLEKYKEQKRKKELLEEIQKVRDTFESNRDRGAFVSGFYHTLFQLEKDRLFDYSLKIGDRVLVHSKAVPDLWGKYIDVQDLNVAKKTITSTIHKGGGVYQTYTLPMAGVVDSYVVDKVTNYIDNYFEGSLSKDYNIEHYVALLFSSYYPAYKMNQNPSNMPYEKRFKTLKPFLSHVMRNYKDNYTSNNSIEDSKYYCVRQANKILDLYRSFDSYHESSQYTQDLNKLYDEVSIGTPKKERKVRVKSKKAEESEDVKQYKAKLSKMSDMEVFNWASELGVTWNEHDNASINRMRAAMAIRKKVIKSAESVQLIVKVDGGK